MVRIVSFAPYLAHTPNLYKELCILTVRELYFYKICILVFKEIAELATCKRYGFAHVNHRYGTRRKCNNSLDLPSTKGRVTNYLLCCFRYIGPRCFNLLPQQVRDCKNIANFKKQLKHHLFSNNTDVYRILYPHK